MRRRKLFTSLEPKEYPPYPGGLRRRIRMDHRRRDVTRPWYVPGDSVLFPKASHILAGEGNPVVGTVVCFTPSGWNPHYHVRFGPHVLFLSQRELRSAETEVRASLLN